MSDIIIISKNSHCIGLDTDKKEPIYRLGLAAPDDIIQLLMLASAMYITIKEQKKRNIYFTNNKLSFHLDNFKVRDTITGELRDKIDKALKFISDNISNKFIGMIHKVNLNYLESYQRIADSILNEQPIQNNK